jgi:hypothetical protein
MKSRSCGQERIFEQLLEDAKGRGRSAVALDVGSWNKGAISLYMRMASNRTIWHSTYGYAIIITVFTGCNMT